MAHEVDSNKAYLFGVLVGGGEIKDGRLSIKFPFKDWGDAFENPSVAGQIGEDILSQVKPIMKEQYDIDLSYQTEPWRIPSVEVTDKLEEELRSNGLPTSGEFRKQADISQVLEWNEVFQKRFVAGLADTIGSVNKNHRLFDENYQIVSFEFNGNNYELVHQFYRLLEDNLGMKVNQILWNHPNQHSGNDPFYTKWKKGFKVRVILSHFISEASFVFGAKTDQAEENLDLQEGEVEVDDEIPFSNPSRKCVHLGEQDDFLPENIRGRHFIHWRHFLAYLEGEDKTGKLGEHLDNFSKLITPYPYPVLKKAERDEIESVKERFPVMRNREYDEKEFDLERLKRLNDNGEKLVYGDGDSGYPIAQILEAINYVLAAQEGNLKGIRPLLGPYDSREDRLEKAIENNREEEIEMLIPERPAPMEIRGDSHSALIGPQEPELYENLIERKGDFEFKVRPLTEWDLRGYE